jgi:SET domain-containing protein
MKLKRNMFKFYNTPGICFIATRMNHSCDPNITYRVVGNELVFKTLKPIKKNEELFDSYIDYNLPKKERQDLLLKRYGFHCTCTKCMNEV